MTGALINDNPRDVGPYFRIPFAKLSISGKESPASLPKEGEMQSK